MNGHWKLEDIHWDAFDASKVKPELLQAVKAASMVEYNARDYVTYLSNVFADDPAILRDINQWGIEEEQHGRALGAWAEIADPSFNFEEAFARFRAGYGLPLEMMESVRGSRAGELLARCVVESGTSSFYSAIKDASDEPLLKEIATHIAADELRHYKLFYNNLGRYSAELPTIMSRLRVAIDRFSEASDDELSFAYYCGNFDPAKESYKRGRCYRSYSRRAFGFYQRHHTDRLISLIANAVGFHPKNPFVKALSGFVFLSFRLRSHFLRLAAA